ncbi:hypothetical protein [Hydrogenophaga sp.]|uniref:hypothetical protein n=1 Tax=Hydrogenophaga sp. TaxID=1904254 RepID=UPI00273116DB|nr:hypothetical protein [Hydrogenophaga sp.]MDP1782207.1 hypothetical protein [Hydrogenophaga sp.]MDP2076346.1 hypothetical protein [Hydrogenophaga sp.]MDP3110339.1 hypothetical protein [Hydrogenophaga sp.]MDP3350184.1 hypothetical protein [Hydrogenophaga sp.]MDZ4283250.1 hypothetical protein [Hydrogenophaga sp.]
MKTPWLLASTTALACFNAQAAGFMFGISHNFGGDTGVTFKILSTDRRNRPVLAAGVSFFPGEGRRIGLDLGVGYNFRQTTVTFGRDLVMERFQMAWGLASRRCPPAPAPVAAPATPPAPPPPPDFFDSSF